MAEGQPLEQDIAVLEQRLAELKAQQSQETGPSDKELLHQAVGERVQEYVQQAQPQISSSPSALPVPDVSEEIKTQAKACADLALQEKGSIESAVSEALKTHNPAVIKELERILVEHFHELIEKRKLPSL